MNLDRIVLGTAALGGVWGAIDEKESVDTITRALESGITAIDTAPSYGEGERLTGIALQKWEGQVPVISTKVGRLKGLAPDKGYYDYSEAGMVKSVENSLQVLGVNQVDKLFLHDPDTLQEHEVESVIKTMLMLREKGYTKKIGLGGNIPAYYNPFIFDGVFDVIMEFNKLNACSIGTANKLLHYCIENEKEYYAASLLNMGLLGASFSSYTSNKPTWMKDGLVERAIRLKQLADTYGMPLSTMSHRFLLSLPFNLKLVIGAGNIKELEASLSDFKAGPLPGSICNKIFNINQEMPVG